MNRNWQTRALFASVLAMTPAVPLLAKNAAHAGTPNSAAPAAAPQPPETLATLGDKRLMSELADRGLDSLLDRYFDLHKTPEDQQKAIRSMEAMRDLASGKLSTSERERKVKAIVDGINTTLPNLTDPFRLANDAGLLMLYGVTHDANLLDYWGENPTTAARLRPVAQAVYDMFSKASKEASAQAGAIASRINERNQNVLSPQWDKFDTLSRNAIYDQKIMAYSLALALPKAERAKLVEETIKYLQDFDTNDSTVMPLVHLTIGKLYMLTGQTEDALKYLQAVANADKSIQPAPDPGQIWQAKYFANVTLMQAGKVAEAEKGLQELEAWQKTGMPADAETVKMTTAADQMLQYRIFLKESELAKDDAAKKSVEDKATKVLLALAHDRPDLRATIYEQLVERLSPDAPVKTMDPLLLQGLIGKAVGEANKPAGSTMDQAVLRRGLAAAQEEASRPPSATLTQAMKDEATRIAPVLMEAVGDKIGAAQGFLAYAKQNANTHRQNAEDALEDAGRLTFELRKTESTDPRVAELYDQFLPIAINPPFNKLQLAYFYGQRLAAERKPAEALKYFHQVPKSDHNYNSAQYLALKANQEMIDTPKITPEQRQVLANDIVRQAESVRQTYANQNEPIARERVGVATLIEAETLSEDLNKPAEGLRLLTGFEDTAKGAPDEKAMATGALLDTVKMNMALGKLHDATASLVALLNRTGGAEGADIVHGLLDRLDSDLNRAEAAGDSKTMGEIARSEAELSGFLVNWAKNNPNAAIKKYTYQYMVFDARTQRLAGALSTDPNEKAKLLQAAMAAYKRLQQPENVALYKATLDPAKVASGDINPNDPDPKIQLGMGLTDFDLKDYKGAAELLGQLLNERKLGATTVQITDAHGEQKIVDNDTYWEATYKLYASNVALAKSPDDSMLDPTKLGLKNLLIVGGIPPKWQDKFEGLRKQIIPDFNVASLSSTTTQPSSAGTQPVSAR